VVTIDFITELAKTTRKHDSIMVVVDKLTKVAHFITVKLAHKVANIVEIYLKKISKLHEYPRKLFQTEIQSLPQTFGRDYSRVLVQI
jgi:hypothetical protein